MGWGGKTKRISWKPPNNFHFHLIGHPVYMGSWEKGGGGGGGREKKSYEHWAGYVSSLTSAH